MKSIIRPIVTGITMVLEPFSEVLPNASKVYVVCTVPLKLANAMPLPSASVRKLSAPDESVRWNTSSTPPIDEFAVIVLPDNSCTGFALS